MGSRKLETQNMGYEVSESHATFSYREHLAHQKNYTFK